MSLNFTGFVRLLKNNSNVELNLESGMAVSVVCIETRVPSFNCA